MAELDFNYKGYALFSDVEDKELRIRNQATVLSNIYEDNPELSDKSSVSKRGALLLFGYMENVFPEDRNQVVIQFHETMKKRGYVHAA